MLRDDVPEREARGARWLGVLAIGAWLGSGGEPWELETPVPAVALRPASLENAGEVSCHECHAELVDEWSRTAHAIAWVDEEYRAALADRSRPRLCYGCHVPEPVLLGRLGSRASAREEDRHLGISCESCHLGADGAYLGPRGTATEAHPTQRSEVFVDGGSSTLCATCHSVNIGPVIGVAKDFESSGQAQRGRSCVGCHMAPVERRWAALPGADVETVPLRLGRSHALQTPRDPAFLRRAFVFSLVDDGRAVLVANGAGHRVPGLIGREIDLRFEALGPAGETLGSAELSIDAVAYLPVDGSARVDLGVQASEVRVTGLHLDPRAEEPIPFVDVTLPGNGTR